MATRAKYGPHTEQIRALAASPSGRLLALGGGRDALGVEASAVHLLKGPKWTHELSLALDAPCGALCFAGDGLLLAGTERGAICGWDATTAAPDRVIDHAPAAGDGAGLRALCADPLGKRVAAVDEGGTLRLFERDESKKGVALKLVGERRLSGRPLRAVAIDPAATQVAAAGDDGVIRALPLDAVKDGPLREMPCGEGGVRALCFTGDGRVAAGCGDGSVRLCFLEGAVDEENRSGDARHAGPVNGLCIGAQLYDKADRELPRRLVSVGEDGVIKAWLLDSRRKPRTLEIRGEPAWALALIPASSRAKPDKRGGTLAVGYRSRRLALVTLNDKGEPGPHEVFGSELSRLADELEGKEPVREAAVKALAELAEDEARELLDGVLAGDRKPALRKLAAELIGRTGRRRSRPALRAALDDVDVDVRRAALAALTAIEADAPLSPVRAALRSRHDEMRLEAVRRLAGLRETSPLVPGLIAERLSDDHAKVRQQALDSLETLWPAPSLEALSVALSRGPADIRIDALIRLGTLRRATDAQGRELLEMALDDEDSKVRGTAFLVAIASQGRLAARLREVDPHTRKALAELSKRGEMAPRQEDDPAEALDDEALAPLFVAIACRSADTALRGARCLALAGDSRATGALLQLSREADPTMRRYAIEALTQAAMRLPGEGHSGDDRSVTRLQWLLDDTDAAVRATAFEALTTLAAPEGAPGRLELAALALRCGFEDTRVRALQILVEFGGSGKLAKASARLTERADALLGDALDDEAAEVRNEAFRTIWAWNSKRPQAALERGAGSRHADVRARVVKELAGRKQREDWVRTALIELVGDGASEVGLAAHKALTKEEADKKKDWEAHLAALRSGRPEVRAAGCAGAGALDSKKLEEQPLKQLRLRLTELVEDDKPQVHLAAIEAIDRLLPEDAQSFALAFGSIFYELRVRAGELCGKRRDKRAIAPMRRLLAIPKTDVNRPSDGLRQRAARALADVGDPATVPLYVSLLDDEDGSVREMGGRGLATACRPGESQPLVDALAHGDLAVRSWAAEGLAKLGDPRSIPVIAGTQRHEHRPIRIGALLSFVALGPDGVRGILQGLEDEDRKIQDLVFAVIVARDVALARAGLPPDLLLSALSSAKAEIRYAAARALEARLTGEDATLWAQELVGPPKPDKASEMKSWPAEEQRASLLNVLVAALASDHPGQRYAAARALSLRDQPDGFWREAGRLAKPTASDHPWIPFTNWEDGDHQPRKRDWVRRIFGSRDAGDQAGGGEAPGETSATERVLTVLKYAGAGRPVPQAAGEEPDAVAASRELRRLVFGTYAGLVRQAPAFGEADETHRVRRDALDRLSRLAAAEEVGGGAVRPILRHALSDPNHLVRKAAVAALRALYEKGSLVPLALALTSRAADVGRAAVDELVGLALGDGVGAEEAASLVKGAIDAPNAEVRKQTLERLPRLFEQGSLEPWLLALESKHADLRLAVVDRLVDAPGEDVAGDRVAGALGKALESDHEDLRLKAAGGLARRGDGRTVDVLAAFLRSEEARVARQATEALVALAHARPLADDAAELAAAAAGALCGRLEDDPDKTADRLQLIAAIARIGSTAGAPTLLALLADEDAALRKRAFEALLELARMKGTERGAAPRRYADGTRRARYVEAEVLGYLAAAAESDDTELRLATIRALRDVDHDDAEVLLARLVEDREEGVRVAAAEALAFRATYLEQASVDSLALALRSGRRELVLPAAAGLATRRRPEALQALLLVLKAGEQPERDRALLALGTLGDHRALEEIEPLCDPRAEIPDEDRQLAPSAVEALGRMLPHLADREEDRDRVRETVERMVREGSEAVRLGALRGLRHAGDDRSRGVLERVAADRHGGRIRLDAVELLGVLGHEGSERTLADLLGDDQSKLRRAAITALQRIFPKDRTRTSMLALGSRHDDVSRPAASFLARRGDAPTLVARLGEVKGAGVRRRLRHGLIRRGACPAAELEALLGGADAGPRADAAWIAGAGAEEGLAKAVAKAVERSADGWREARDQLAGAPDGNGELATAEASWRASLWAARRLGAKVGPAARDVVEEASYPVRVRCEAIRYLATHGTRKDAEPLREALSDREGAVRAAAAAGLAAVAPDGAGKALTDLVAASAGVDVAALYPAVVAALPKAAAELLGSDGGRQLALPACLGQGRVEELCAVATAKGKDPARLVAIAALGRIGGEQAEAALQEILDSKGEEDAVRAAAFKALRRLQRRADKRFDEDQDQERGGRFGGGHGGYDDDDDDDDYDDDDDDE